MINEGHEPLSEYPWSEYVELLLTSKLEKSYNAFLFDCVMSLAYVDATAGIERHIESCPHAPNDFTAHVGFTNLCATCYEAGIWQYQKAAKPQSGALGKLSSELILKFIQHASDKFIKVLAIGGSGYADAYIEHASGVKILAEVKSAPLVTYPLLVGYKTPSKTHQKMSLTSSQFKEGISALYMHNGLLIPLGKISAEGWPFKQFVEYLLCKKNTVMLSKFFSQWNEAKTAYINKDKKSKIYYLTNACGNPPIEARHTDSWLKGEVISDGKTSAGMDRTDDIKKAIYQTLKIGINHKHQSDYKTAIISNLPAFRHQNEYVNPLIPVLWGMEDDLILMSGMNVISRDKLNYLFDYIITLESPLLRALNI